MQTVLSNPLAEPYTLGIASGAALGAAIGMSLGLTLNFFGLNLGAVVGAVFVLLILLKLVSRGSRESGSMILLGMMLSLTGASLLAIWMALADPMGVQSVNFWLLGDLSRVGLTPAVSLLCVVGGMSAYFWMISRKLDAFLFGEELVSSFGVSKIRTQKTSIILVTILVGLCVSAVGMIGFVGLVVPHLVRKAIRTSRHHHLIPLSVLWGAVVLTLSDALARSIAEPHELPVGAITAVVGAPIFIILFLKRSRGALS